MPVTDKTNPEDIHPLTTVNVGLANQPKVETVIKSINDEFKNKIIVQEDVLYYYYTQKYGSEQEVKWCFEAGIPVWGYDDFDDYKDDINPASVTLGEYKESGEVFVCAPDLSGFSRKNTYYVTYKDKTKNEPTYTSIRKGIPENWYNYGKDYKEWANIVTIENENDFTGGAYFVWIPRYIYKLNTSSEDVDIRFVDSKNVYKYRDSDGQIKTIEYELANAQTGEMRVKGSTENSGYKLPEAFWWDNDENGQRATQEEISGFWVSKYEVSDYISAMFKINSTSVTITRVDSNAPAYDIYVNDNFYATVAKANIENYKIEGLNPYTEYKITISTSGESMVGKYEEKILTLKQDINTLAKPDLSGFDLNNTYYVMYDYNGNEVQITDANKSDYVIGDGNGNIRQTPNSSLETWYDYDNKHWANIVTISNGKKAYFTWIPRYEYKLKDKFQEVQIRLLAKDETSATNGYKIPEAFWWDNNENGRVDTENRNGNVDERLTGFWVSKYEVSQYPN